MHEVYELVPMVAGIAIGLLCGAMAPGRRRLVVLAVLSVVCGAAATIATGEFRESWGYLLFDIPLTAGVAVAAMLTLSAVSALVRSKRS